MNSSTSHSSFRVAALYRFCRLEAFEALREPLVQLCRAHGIKGTLLLAGEGINGTVAGSEAAIATLIAHLQTIPGLAGMEVKFSAASDMPFHRLKVRLKKEIVTMGVGDIDPASGAGTYVDPIAWNALISDPDTVVVDTRNEYEVAIGTFRNAVNPQTQSFRDFPEWVAEHRQELEGRKVAMFCTGGIRCEKATAYARSLGLEEVYDLKGGIL